MKTIILIVCCICFLSGCRYLDQKIIQRSEVSNLDPNQSIAVKQSYIYITKSQSEPLTIIDTIKPWHISWSIEGDDTNMPQEGLEFDVEKTDTLINPTWTLFCQTNQPPVAFYFTGSQGFFRVGVHFVTLSMPAPFGR